MEIGAVPLQMVLFLVTVSQTNVIGRNTKLEIDTVRRDREPRAVGDCGGTYTGTGGVFSSPGYPNSYGNSADCNYHIEVPSGHRIILTFNSFDTESGFDYVMIYDGPEANNNLLVQFSGDSTVLDDVMSTSNHFYLEFHSDSSTTGEGFYGTYISFAGDFPDVTYGPDVSACGLYLPYQYVQSIGGVISSHDTYPDSYHNALEGLSECSLTFRALYPFTHISVNFTDLDIYGNTSSMDPGCDNSDVLVFTNGDSDFTYCDGGPQVGTTVQLLLEATLHFYITAWPTEQHRGFQGTYVQFYYPTGTECDSPGEFLCVGRGRCISYVFVCDGREHCSDGSDESNCNLGENANGVDVALIGGLMGGVLSVLALGGVVLLANYCEKMTVNAQAIAPQPTSTEPSSRPRASPSTSAQPSTSGPSGNGFSTLSLDVEFSTLPGDHPRKSTKPPTQDSSDTDFDNDDEEEDDHRAIPTAPPLSYATEEESKLPTDPPVSYATEEPAPPTYDEVISGQVTSYPVT